MHLAILAACLLVTSGSALAETFPDTADVEGGTLNPEELALNRVMKDAAEGHTSMTVCATG
jgi:hypothetical protein